MRSVLVTGATGFLGGAMAAHLIDSHPELGLVLPARPRDGLSPADRVHASLIRQAAKASERVAIPEVERAGSWAELSFAGVTHVVHFAVDTTMSGRSLNIDGTLALARAALRARVDRFVYIGSAWSCGHSARGVVGEDDATAGDPLFSYLADKLVAERLLAALPSLPLQILRPSLVLGHTVRGCEPSASLFWLLRLIDRLRRLPWSLDQSLDVVPVDWLVAAIAKLMFAPLPARTRTLHLSAGVAGRLSWRQIEKSFARGATRPWAAEPRSIEEWSAQAADVTQASSQLRQTLSRCMRFLSGDALFDNERMLAAGVSQPPSLSSYLDVCLRKDGGRTLGEQALDDA
jgi:nucleoside-diphosphate-sugar epimerase